MIRPDYDRVLSREQKRRKHAVPEIYSSHLAYGRKWRKSHPEKVKKFKHESAEQKALRQAKRHAAKIRAVAGWSDIEAVNMFFTVAKRLTACLGFPFEVDHVIPLQGKLVCGLHVHTNLQVIPAAINRRKTNKVVTTIAA